MHYKVFYYSQNHLYEKITHKDCTTFLDKNFFYKMENQYTTNSTLGVPSKTGKGKIFSGEHWLALN